MLLMFGISEGVEELGVARPAADIFGRAAAAGGDEDRQAEAGEAQLDLLDLDRVLPAIAEVEYWAHEASLLPLDLHPLLRWRMARADRGEAGWTALRVFAGERRAEAEALLMRIREEGPLTAADFEGGKGRGGWWDWGDTKRALEWLFWSGRITTAARRPSFARVYDLSERVIPASILSLPTPSEADAHRALIERSARALGIATATDLRDYFRLGPDDARSPT